MKKKEGKIKKIDVWEEALKLNEKRGCRIEWAEIKVIEKKINEIIDYLNTKL